MEVLPKKLFLAPMAETSTPALRHIIKDCYPETIVCSEMLSAGAIAARAPHNEPLVTMREFDEPLIYQIVGSDPAVMADACAILSKSNCFAIDVNMGCPNHDIVKKGQGAKLLTDIDKAAIVIRACRKATRTLLSVKMRTGYEANDEQHFLNFIRMLESEGVDFITIHPRYARLGFRRTAEWHLVALAKQHVSIPIIGNGDIDTPEAAVRRMAETSCDGVMIGREAIKSPWIFRLAADLINGRNTVFKINIRDIFIKTLGYIREYLPERLHKSRSHRFCAYYSRNARYGHELFTKIRREGDIGLIQELVDNYYHRNSHEVEKTFVVHDGKVFEMNEQTPLSVQERVIA
jgi:nifR3 family TIM-barrel protein